MALNSLSMDPANTQLESIKLENVKINVSKFGKNNNNYNAILKNVTITSGIKLYVHFQLMMR